MLTRANGDEERDFWEGEQFEMVGKVFYYFVPILAALGLVVGAVASQTYNTGADVFIKSATSDDSSALLIPAKDLLQ